jgi:hypothetical protein
MTTTLLKIGAMAGTPNRRFACNAAVMIIPAP